MAQQPALPTDPSVDGPPPLAPTPPPVPALALALDSAPEPDGAPTEPATPVDDSTPDDSPAPFLPDTDPDPAPSPAAPVATHAHPHPACAAAPPLQTPPRQTRRRVADADKENCPPTATTLSPALLAASDLLANLPLLSALPAHTPPSKKKKKTTTKLPTVYVSPGHDARSRKRQDRTRSRRDRERDVVNGLSTPKKSPGARAPLRKRRSPLRDITAAVVRDPALADVLARPRGVRGAGTAAARATTTRGGGGGGGPRSYASSTASLRFNMR